MSSGMHMKVFRACSSKVPNKAMPSTLVPLAADDWR